VTGEEAGCEGVVDREARSSLAGTQSPPPALPPLPRMQRRLNMQQPRQQRQRQGQQQHAGASGGCSSAGAADIASTGAGKAEAADGCGDDAAEGGAPRVRSTRRCNSSCGHGRHANFWSRVSVNAICRPSWAVSG
jgi:hypothetical protein